MRHLTIWILLLVTLYSSVITSCSNGDSYADQKERERSAISSFMSKGALVKATESGNDTILYVPPITNIITESQFEAQDSTTDVSKNQYVLFSGTGIYMQIIRKGSGSKLASGETANIICRYIEYNIMGDSIQSRNDALYYIATPDIMTCYNSYGTFTASFISGVMQADYSAAVPTGWLKPLTYINLGRQSSASGEIAKVRLIVPHTQGQKNATSNVYPCFYEITYQRGR